MACLPGFGFLFATLVEAGTGRAGRARDAAQGAALGRRSRRLGCEHGPRPPGPPHHQDGAGPAWIEFGGAAQVAQLRRTVTKKGRKTVEVVYLITSDRDADPAALAAWVRSHWEIENRLHWVGT